MASAFSMISATDRNAASIVTMDFNGCSTRRGIAMITLSENVVTSKCINRSRRNLSR
jgi:hypothetical protein